MSVLSFSIAAEILDSTSKTKNRLPATPRRRWVAISAQTSRNEETHSDKTHQPPSPSFAPSSLLPHSNVPLTYTYSPTTSILLLMWWNRAVAACCRVRWTRSRELKKSRYGVSKVPVILPNIKLIATVHRRVSTSLRWNSSVCSLQFYRHSQSWQVLLLYLHLFINLVGLCKYFCQKLAQHCL